MSYWFIRNRINIKHDHKNTSALTRPYSKTMKIIQSTFLLIVVLFSSCNTTSKIEKENYLYPITECPDPSLTEYKEFKPSVIKGFELENYQIDQAFEIDAISILAAYTEGDLMSSNNPQNWGDCLIAYANDTIQFQSHPVGDVYLYEPHFYKNQKDNTVIIVCQLGYEYYFGGEAFILTNGKLEYIGLLDIESTNPELSLTDILMIKKVDQELRFEFQSDSLVFKPGEDDIIINNNNIYYSYKDNKLQLIGS